jgi:hypothetical protein
MNHIESKLSTQNSVVVVKGDESIGNMDWYGVIKRIILLDFPHGHYIRNSNRRHRSEMRAKAIVSDLEKRDAPASARIRTGSVEDKRRRSTFRRVSAKLISETRPLL